MAKREPDDKEQSARFIKKARELEADESKRVFERAFKKIVPPKPAKDAKASKAKAPRRDDAERS